MKKATAVKPDDAQLTKLANIVDALNDKLRLDRKTLVEFAEKFTENPSRAMEWSISTFAAAARVKVFEEVRRAITTADNKPELHRTKQDGTTFNTLDNLIEYSQKEVNRRAGSSSRSTSPTSNLMEQEYLSAWADIIEIIRWN